MSSLKYQTVSGIKWQVGVSILQKAISFIATIFLARHLGPATFGLFAFAMVIIGSFELFKSMGIDSALIRRQNDFEKAANTAFIIIPLLGILLLLVVFFSAPFIGEMLNNSEIIPVLRVLGAIFVFSCFARVPSSILEKKMEFKKLSIVDFWNSLVFSVFAVIFAFLNFGVWSLVYAYVLKSFLNMAQILFYAQWKPRLEFDRKIALEMFDFGKFLFLATALGFLRANLDNFLVGKLLGITMLGFYAVAFNIANFGYDYFGVKITRVAYPAYTKLTENVNELKSAFLKTFKYTAIAAMPLGIATFILAKEFILVAYGEKWIDATGVLRALAWIAIFNTLPVSSRAVFLAKNKPKLDSWFAGIQVILFLAFIFPASRFFSVAGVGAVVSISSFIAFIYSLYCLRRIISLRVQDVYAALKPSLMASLLMSASLVGLKNLTSNFFILAMSGLFFYGLGLFVSERRILSELRGVIFNSANPTIQRNTATSGNL